MNTWFGSESMEEDIVCQMTDDEVEAIKTIINLIVERNKQNDNTQD